MTTALTVKFDKIDPESVDFIAQLPVCTTRAYRVTDCNGEHLGFLETCGFLGWFFHPVQGAVRQFPTFHAAKTAIRETA